MEMREEEIRLGMEQTRKNLALASFATEEGSESNNHGSEQGVPPEVAAEEVRLAAREASNARIEEMMRGLEREHMEDDAAN